MTKVGLQLYTVREEMAQDFEGTLRKIAELGYQGVEFHEFLGRSAEEIRSILKETGLEIIGAHTSYDRLLNHLDEEIAFNKEIGNRNLIFPFLEEHDRGRFDEIIEDIRGIAEVCKREGMKLLYHNHDFELTLQLGGQPVLDVIYDRVPAELLLVELDSCWVHFAGYDALAYIRKYTGRMPLLHWKDVKRGAQGEAETVELGTGEVDVKAIADAGIAAKVDWLIVEQDFSARGAMESIAISMDYVKNYQQQGGQIHV